MFRYRNFMLRYSENLLFIQASLPRNRLKSDSVGVAFLILSRIDKRLRGESISIIRVFIIGEVFEEKL